MGLIQPLYSKGKPLQILKVLCPVGFELIIGESDLIPNLEFTESFFFFLNNVYLHMVELIFSVSDTSCSLLINED